MRIVIRIREDEYARIVEAAGEEPVSTFLRRKILEDICRRGR